MNSCLDNKDIDVSVQEYLWIFVYTWLVKTHIFFCFFSREGLKEMTPQKQYTIKGICVCVCVCVCVCIIHILYIHI